MAEQGPTNAQGIVVTRERGGEVGTDDILKEAQPAGVGRLRSTNPHHWRRRARRGPGSCIYKRPSPESKREAMEGG